MYIRTHLRRTGQNACCLKDDEKKTRNLKCKTKHAHKKKQDGQTGFIQTGEEK